MVTFFASANEVNCTRSPDSTDELLHCKTTLKSYPRPVHFFIPAKLSDTPQIFVHFHGHNLEGYDHFNPLYGNYGQYLLNSHANAIVVVPESLGKCTTYDTFFANKDNSAQFFSELENHLAGKVVALSGHSGAYRVLNRLMGYVNAKAFLQDVKALGMFDAAYGATPEINKWVHAHAEDNILFFMAYVTGDKATTEDGALLLKKDFKQISEEKVQFVKVSGFDSESLLDQHFMTLKRGGLEAFFFKASSL